MPKQCCEYTLEDIEYLRRLKYSKELTNYISNIPVMTKEPYCIRVKSDQNDESVILDKCSNSLNFYPKLSTGRLDESYSDNLFYYDQYTSRIFVARGNDKCLEAQGNSLKSTKCSDSENQKFQIVKNNSDASDSNNKIIKLLKENRCVKADQFVSKANTNLKEGNNDKIDIDATVLTMAPCPQNQGETEVTPFDVNGDFYYVIGRLPGLAGTMYLNLAKKYNELMTSTNTEMNELLEAYVAKALQMQQELNLQIQNYNDQVTVNAQLQNKLIEQDKTVYDLIQAQTASILAKVKSMQQINSTEHKTNVYQVEQNVRLKKIHTILFWCYFVVASIFLLVLGIQTKFLSVTFFAFVVIVAIYPFTIIFIEYGLVYLFFYFKAFLTGTPFVYNKLPPTNSIFFKP